MTDTAMSTSSIQSGLSTQGVLKDLKKEIWTHVTTRTDAENVILSERSQTQKNTEFGLTHRSLKESDPQRQGERWWGQGLGKVVGSQCFTGQSSGGGGCKRHEHA